MTSKEISWRDKWTSDKRGPYEQWQETENIPVIHGFFVDDLTAVPVEPWERMGGKGAFINLDGAGGVCDCYVSEIPPGSSLKPQKHLFEETVLVLKGRGATTVWQEGGRKQTFEWQEGSLFAPPINTWYQHFNGHESEPARYASVTTAPLIFNLFRNSEFVLSNPFQFKDRYADEEGAFSGKGKAFADRVWETNFVPDVYQYALTPWRERGYASTNVMFEMAGNTMKPHISEFPVGTYKKAHRHGPGAHVFILNGTGYSLLWPDEGQPKTKVDWHKYSMFVPPDFWFHQHFNAGKDPARYYAVTWGHLRVNFSIIGRVDASHKDKGNQIEYPDEDTDIMETFESELAKSSLKPMPLEDWRK